MYSLLTVREAVIAHLPAWKPQRILSRSTSFRGQTACRQWRLQVIENLAHCAGWWLTFPTTRVSPSSREGWPSHGLRELGVIQVRPLAGCAGQFRQTLRVGVTLSCTSRTSSAIFVLIIAAGGSRSQQNGTLLQFAVLFRIAMAHTRAY